MSGFHDNVLLGASGSQGYQISRSVRLRSSASAYLNRTFTSVGTRTKFTYSAWLKRGTLGSFSRFLSDSTNNSYLRFNTSNALDWNFHNGTSSFTIVTSQVFRDPSAWYHVIVAVDTTQATNTNRVKIYVNGSQVTAFSSSAYPNQNDVSGFNNNTAHYISGYSATAEFLDGYITEVNFIDGQALDPSSFGETNVTTGVWQPKRYTGTYGTNGFYLNFSDNSAATAAAIGKDYSGNGNNWTPNNISVTAGVTYDSMLDVPTQWADGGNGRGNYCTLNPLQSRSAPSRANLEFTQPNAGHGPTVGTIGMTTGKWYWEVEVTTFNSASSSIHIGIVGDNYPFASGNYIGNTATSYAYRHSGQKYNNAASSAYGATYAAGDVIGVALDLDAGTLVFYKNNTSQGTAYSSISGTFYPAVSLEQSGSTSTVQANFGQRPFAYTPPSGFKALNTLNLPTPTILKGNQYFDATTYTGTGVSRSVTNVGGFAPDLVWIKSRSNAYFHQLYDTQRGVQKALYSNDTLAETTETTGLTAFGADGFTVSTGAGVNQNAATYVGWQWKEGATQGFDIVTFTKASSSQTVNHSLGVTPAMMIVKGRGPSASNWLVYHKNANASPQNGGLAIEQTSAFSANAGYWNNTSPTSTQFTVGSFMPNENSVAYLFSEVAGFSRFGSYTGNGSTDGPFLFFGFRARWIMYKRTDSTGQWNIIDTARNTFNQLDTLLRANLSNADETNAVYAQDITANGWKIRSTNVDVNASGATYIFAAFSEVGFKFSLAR